MLAKAADISVRQSVLMNVAAVTAARKGSMCREESLARACTDSSQRCHALRPPSTP